MINILSGANLYLLRKTLNDLVEKFAKENGELAVERIDASDVSTEQLVAAVSSVPFLSNKKMIIIRELSSQKDLSENLEKLISQVGNTTDLIIYEPKLDKRSSYYKKLKNLEGFREFSQLGENELAKWLIESVKHESAELSFADANYLIERAGVDQQRLSSELEKLIRYNSKITRSNIDLLVEPLPQTSIFELIDSAFNGNSNKTLALYDQQRAQGVEPLNILGMFVWQLHVVSLVKASNGQSVDKLSTESGIKPFVLQKSQRISRSIGIKKLNKLIEDLIILDKTFKTTTTNQDAVLKNLLVGLAISS